MFYCENLPEFGVIRKRFIGKFRPEALPGTAGNAKSTRETPHGVHDASGGGCARADDPDPCDRALEDGNFRDRNATQCRLPAVSPDVERRQKGHWKGTQDGIGVQV